MAATYRQIMTTPSTETAPAPRPTDGYISTLLDRIAITLADRLPEVASLTLRVTNDEQEGSELFASDVRPLDSAAGGTDDDAAITAEVRRILSTAWGNIMLDFAMGLYKANGGVGVDGWRRTDTWAHIHLLRAEHSAQKVAREPVLSLSREAYFEQIEMNPLMLSTGAFLRRRDISEDAIDTVRRHGFLTLWDLTSLSESRLRRELGAEIADPVTDALGRAGLAVHD